MSKSIESGLCRMLSVKRHDQNVAEPAGGVRAPLATEDAFPVLPHGFEEIINSVGGDLTRLIHPPDSGGVAGGH